MPRRVATPDELERAVRKCGPERARVELRRYGLIPPIEGRSGIAIDASTPAFVAKVNSYGTTLTTTSFSPPAGSLLVCAAINPNGGGDGFTISDNRGTHLTYKSIVASSGSLNLVMDMYIADVPTSGAMTVTATISNNRNDWAFGVVVVTGAEPVTSQNGATVAVENTTSSITATLASLVGSNSLVIGAITDITASTTPTIPAGQSDVFNSHTFFSADSTNHVGRWMQYLTGMNLSSGSSATINCTAPTSDSNGILVAEILAASGGGSVATPNPQMINWPQAMWRSAYR